MRNIRAGFVGFGEVHTPKEYIISRCEHAVKSLKSLGIDLVSIFPISDDEEGSARRQAITELSKEPLDLLILCVAGWIPSWAVIEVISRFKNIPMVLWGLTGWREGDRFVTTADQAGTTALRAPMEEMGFTFLYLPTFRGEPPDTETLLSYAEAARGAMLLKSARIGMAGYRDMRLYNTQYDAISLKAKIGVEIEHFDLLEIVSLQEKLDEREISSMIEKIKKRWIFLKEPKPETMENSVRLFLAFKKKIEERGYKGFSYLDVDGIKKLMGFAPAGSMTLLHDELDISSAPENDSLGVVTQLMVRFLTGKSAAYLEFYEFLRDGALIGVPDYIPSAVIEGKVSILPTSFGKLGEGMVNVSRMKTGPVTLCRLGYKKGSYTMHTISGIARSPEQWEEAGWSQPAPQLPGLEITFDGSVESFIQKVLAQHYILSYGDNRLRLEHLCRILGIEMI